MTSADPRPLSNLVYNELHRQISDGIRGPLTRLVQEQIGQELEISRTPVREALSRLAQDGLATWVPGRGYLVSEVRRADITEVQQVREALEAVAFRSAIEHFTAFDRRHLENVHQAMIDADRATADFFELNRQFHQALAAPCPNALVLRILDDTWALPVSRRLTGRYISVTENIDAMISEHTEIIEALDALDHRGAVELLQRHISKGYGDIQADDQSVDDADAPDEVTD